MDVPTGNPGQTDAANLFARFLAAFCGRHRLDRLDAWVLGVIIPQEKQRAHERQNRCPQRAIAHFLFGVFVEEQQEYRTQGREEDCQGEHCPARSLL
jgi:hypothetical protein